MQNPKLTRISGSQPLTSLAWWLLCLMVKLSIPGAQVGEHVGGGGQPEVGDAGASAAGDGGRSRLGLLSSLYSLTCGISTTPLSTLV